MVIRDRCPGHAVELGLTGTDCCESYFSESGSFVLNRHTYSFQDLMNTTSKMTTINLLGSRNNIQLNKVHSKQETIWSQGHPDMVNLPPSCDIPSDSQLAKAWTNGEEEARDIWRFLGVSSEHADWFLNPHKIDHVSTKRAGSSDLNDEDTPVVTTDTSPDDIDDMEIESHLRQILDANDRPQPIISIPEVGDVHKSTIVTMLNSGQHSISKDRLLRVRANSNCTSDPDIESSNSFISLFSDVLIKSGRSFLLGRVQRILHCGTTRVEWSKHVDIPCTDQAAKVTIHLYEADAQDYAYTNNSKVVSGICVIKPIDISYNIDTNRYTLSAEDSEALKSCHRH